MNNINLRSRCFNFVLYPDDETHKKALNYIEKNYQYYAYILHDKDLTDEKEPKKNHWHIVVKFVNPRWKQSVCDELGISYNYCDVTNSLKFSLLYLVHFGNANKVEYDLTEVHGPLFSSLEKYIRNSSEIEDERLINIVDLIYSYNGYLSFTELLRVVCDNGLYGDYRRGFSILKEIVIEHNAKYVSRIDVNND